MGARRLAGLVTSLVVHGGALAALVAAVGGGPVPALLYVDLTREPAAGDARERGSVPAGPATAGPRPTPAPRPVSTPRPIPTRAGRPPSAARTSVVTPAPPPARPVQEPPAWAPPPAISVPVPVSPPAATSRSESPHTPQELPHSVSSVVPPSSPGREAQAGDASHPGAGWAESPTASDAPSGGETGSGASGMGRPTGAEGGPGAGRARASTASRAPAAEAADYSEYLEEVRRQIQEALHYPLAARRRGLSGTVLVEISIGADGAIGSAELADSSSHRILDDAALDAVRTVRPTPFPAGAVARPIRVRLPVVFELR